MDTSLVDNQCPVCAAKGLGAAKIRNCHLGKCTPYTVAEELTAAGIPCSMEQVMVHINESHEIQEDEQGQLQSEDILLNRLMTNANTMERWIKFVIQGVQGPKDIDMAKIRMLTTLMKETRATIESIAELQGRMGPGDINMQINVLNNRVVDLTNTVIANCCPECKLKILTAMEDRQAELHSVQEGSKWTPIAAR